MHFYITNIHHYLIHTRQSKHEATCRCSNIHNSSILSLPIAIVTVTDSPTSAPTDIPTHIPTSDQRYYNSTEVTQIIVISLIAYDNVQIISTIITGTQVIIELQLIVSNNKLDTDEIETVIEDTTKDKYDKEIDVTVTDVTSTV